LPLPRVNVSKKSTTFINKVIICFTIINFSQIPNFQMSDTTDFSNYRKSLEQKEYALTSQYKKTIKELEDAQQNLVWKNRDKYYAQLAECKAQIAKIEHNIQHSPELDELETRKKAIEDEYQAAKKRIEDEKSGPPFTIRDIVKQLGPETI
jgi:type I site-specific restriction endonuclease